MELGRWAVAWGRRQMSLEGVRAFGVDEIQWSRGHNYVTVVYHIDAGCRRSLWVGPIGSHGLRPAPTTHTPRDDRYFPAFIGTACRRARSL